MVDQGNPVVNLAVPMTSDLVPVQIGGQSAQMSAMSPFLGQSSSIDSLTALKMAKALPMLSNSGHLGRIHEERSQSNLWEDGFYALPSDLRMPEGQWPEHPLDVSVCWGWSFPSLSFAALEVFRASINKLGWPMMFLHAGKS